MKTIEVNGRVFRVRYITERDGKRIAVCKTDKLGGEFGDEHVLGDATPNRNLAAVRAVITANRAAGRETYAGLESHEIGLYSRASMFGDNGEAFPSREEWSRIVD